RAEKQHVGRRNGRDQRHGNRERRSFEKRKLARQHRQGHWQQQPVQVVLTYRNLVLQRRRDDSTHAGSRAVTRRFVANPDSESLERTRYERRVRFSPREAVSTFSSLSPDKSRLHH